jgi:hypothetical protein
MDVQETAELLEKVKLEKKVCPVCGGKGRYLCNCGCGQSFPCDCFGLYMEDYNQAVDDLEALKAKILAELEKGEHEKENYL